MQRHRVAAALVGSCLGGCVSLGSDGSSELQVEVGLFWEEVPQAGGDDSCESAGIDLIRWRLLDGSGDVVGCAPRDELGGCDSDAMGFMHSAGAVDQTAPCADVISLVVPPGEYSLAIDGFRGDCPLPLWHAVCDSIFLDRFDQRYDCTVESIDSAALAQGDGACDAAAAGAVSESAPAKEESTP